MGLALRTVLSDHRASLSADGTKNCAFLGEQVDRVIEMPSTFQTGLTTIAK